MRAIVVGYGVQGKKRLRVAGSDAAGVVDPIAAEANWRDIREAPLDSYDAALVCTPDEPKIELLSYLLGNGKHVLVEKPLHAKNVRELDELEATARRTGAVCYTAYNHRFEPHYVRMRDLIRSGDLGRIYRCRMFYGNGTARLVRDSAWRDQGAGVLPDLGSHLLDTARFWFGDLGEDFRLVSVSRFENLAPDNVVIASESSKPKLEFEMTLLSWRNHFTCDILAEKGTAHIESLCKWGPSTFTKRTRILPSGRPPEEAITLVQDDPTWALEYDHFKRLVADQAPTDLANDRWLLRVLGRLSADAIKTGQ
ncbi:gfo/Idh/MocA family oxidoreductase [Pseudolabrys taiwanensis]|uniref:Gfo/Idh/MocA family oxidoreductase n=1 Tax=Pseudolabrys taiwanensis TaxID=331696 RepID=A0A345ZQ45_9HYPH|nr:Gfo/Idh/MocA family oxidoreductase [Pseudolabrys taiwanensis]AXK79042.1 gfo/Idh/MocA family oxidoreductase [Pseudolabrys taiwanensis]